MSACELRRWHVPSAPATDSHHVIPQAWQRFQVPESLTLWDRRTVEVCPNCHRRVHEAIVAMMKAGKTEDPLEAKLRAFKNRRLTREQNVAFLGLCRFKEAGGSLIALRKARLFGAQ